MPQPIVAVQNLNHYYGEGRLRRQILFEVNLAIYPGEFVIMTGPSGSGKSTLLSLVGCLRSLQEGSLKVLGQELVGASDDQRTRMRQNFGYIFQASNLVTFLTVEQNIASSLHLQGVLDDATIREKISQILDDVSLLPQQKFYPHQLSGGQKQRAAIAGALAPQPKLVLADEPTAALDSKTGRQIIDLIHRLAKEQGSAVLMVTHDPRILDVADRIINMEDGNLGLAYSQEISLALPGLKEEQVTAMNIQPDLLTYEPGAIVFREGDSANLFYTVVQGRVEAYHDEGNGQRKVLNTLERGQFFGEIGLLNPDSRRSASIRVTDDAPAKLMTIKRDDFQQLMQVSNLTEMVIAQTLQDRMNRTVLAKALPSAAGTIQPLLRHVERRKYDAGTTIIQQGAIADYFYVVVAGFVEVITVDSQDQPRLLTTLGPGDYFGEIGLFEQRPRTVTVRTKVNTSVELMALPASAFQELIETSQMTYDAIAHMVYERLKNTTRSEPY